VLINVNDVLIAFCFAVYGTWPCSLLSPFFSLTVEDVACCISLCMPTSRVVCLVLSTLFLVLCLILLVPVIPVAVVPVSVDNMLS